MCCSPFVTQSLAADDCSSGSSRAGRVGPSVLRLVRKELHRPAWQVRNVSCPNGSRLIGPHERTIPSPKEELGIDQRTEQRVTRRAVETPEPLCLRRRQTQSGHFDVLALNASKNVVKRLLCWHVAPPFPVLSIGHVRKSNARATGRARLRFQCSSRNS